MAHKDNNNHHHNNICLLSNLITYLKQVYMVQTPHRWGTALSWQWGLWAPRVLQIPLFRNPKGRRLSPPVWPSKPSYGGTNISGDPVQSVFAGRSGSTTNCEHSQELTPGLLELKATGVYLRLFSRLRATPVVVGSLATVPPGDHFLSPIPDGRGSYERGLRSTLVYRLELF